MTITKQTYNAYQPREPTPSKKPGPALKTINKREKYSNGRPQWIHKRCGHHRKREHWSHAFGHLQIHTYAPYYGEFRATHCSLISTGQTGTLLSGKNEITIQIQFTKEKIMWQREHATFITAREPNCLWSITDLRPHANNHTMATVTPIKRNNSKLTTGQYQSTWPKTLSHATSNKW